MGSLDPVGVRQDLLDEVACARARCRSSTATRPATGTGSGCSASKAIATGQACCARIDRDDLSEDERFATSVGRREHCAALIAELDDTFAARDYEEWTERFDAHDVWWAPVNTLRDVLDDPQANAAGMFVDMAGIDGEPYRSVSTPVRFSPATDHVASPGRVPTLGEHTAEVLAELDLS